MTDNMKEEEEERRWCLIGNGNGIDDYDGA